jgi:hypothetical protein
MTIKPKVPVVPPVQLTPRERLEGKIFSYDQYVKSKETSIRNLADEIEKSLIDKAAEVKNQMYNAADEGKIRSATVPITSLEMAGWAVNSLMWLVPNMRVDLIQTEAARLDGARKDLADARAELAALIEKEQKEIRE